MRALILTVARWRGGAVSRWRALTTAAKDHSVPSRERKSGNKKI